jgi:hypothetical protein
MYGMVNKAVQDLLVTNHGEDVWHKIRSKAGLQDEVFISTESYPDEVTYKLVVAASEVLDLPAESILNQFGRWWVLKTAKHGYGQLLAAGGRDLGEFLQNLPNFNTRVSMVFSALQPPEFRCTEVAPRQVRLHYLSHRRGLSAFVIGLLEGLGEMFSVAVQIVHEQKAGDGVDHDVFLVSWNDLPTS